MASNIQTNLLLKVSADIAGAKNGLGTLNNSINGIGSTVMKVGAIIASGFALRDVITTTQRWADQLGELNDALGLSGDAAARWAYQARVVGIDADTLVRATEGLTRRITSQTEAILKGESEFDRFGISVLDATGNIRPMTDIIEDTRARIQELGPGLQSRQLELALFGRTGGQLHDFFSLANDEIERMDEDLKALGLPTNIAELEAMNREGNRLGFIFDSIKIKLGSALIPVLLAAGRGLAQLSSYVKVLGEALRTPLGILKEVVARLSTFIGQIKDLGFGTALRQLFDDALSAIPELLGRIGEKLDSFGPLGTIAKDALLALGALRVVNAIQGTALAVAGIGAAIRAIPLKTVLVFDVVLVGVALEAIWQNIVLITDNWENLRRAVHDGTLQATGLVELFLVRLVEWGDNFSALGTTVRGVFDGIGVAIQTTLANVGRFFDNLITEIIGKLNEAILKFNEVTRLNIPTVEAPRRFEGGPTGRGPQLGVPIDQLPLDQRKEWLRRTFPQNFGGGGGSLIAAASGFHGVVNRPQMFLAGERGTETVDITPGGRGSGTTIIVNVSGNITRSEKDLADIVGSEIMRRIGTRRAVAF